MNILITHSWLKTLLEIDKQPRVIAEFLSLSGPSVEKVEKVGDDFVYHIEVTSNRPDVLSVWGIAREVYAKFRSLGLPVKLKDPRGLYRLPKLEKKELPLKVKIEKEDLCPRFTAVILDDVTIKPSSPWMRKHLELSGIRSLNNIVDIANYLMLELGQPMHTFDYDKIKKATMILRESKEGEEIVTLDGVARKLKKGAIVIEDEKRLIDLCGIMGGENSQIDEQTKRILLFVQTYNPLRIRKTSRDLNLITEASTRFEKGLDTEGVIYALNRAVFLAKELAGAKVASKVIDIYPKPYRPRTVRLTKEKLGNYLGLEVPLSKAAEILASLGFETDLTRGQIRAKVPSFRAGDIEIEEDLIEEVARVWGYDALPSLLPVGEIRPETSNIFYWEDRIKNYFRSQGFAEAYTYSMVSKEDLVRVGFDPESTLKIRNPLNLDLEYMRPTLLPSLLKVLAKNQKKSEDLKFFEIANYYLPKKEGKLPEERLRISGIWQTHLRRSAAEASERKRQDFGGQASDFYAFKGILEGLFDDLGIKTKFAQGEIANLVSGQSAYILKGEKELGRTGKVDQKVAQSFGVEESVYVFGLDFDLLAAEAKLTREYVPLSKYPEVQEDISMIIDERQEIGRILEVLEKAGGQLLKKTQVFDVFHPSAGGSKLGKDKKSVAIHLYYQSQTHNLSSKEVEGVRQKIINALEKEIGAKVRLKE